MIKIDNVIPYMLSGTRRSNLLSSRESRHQRRGSTFTKSALWDAPKSISTSKYHAPANSTPTRYLSFLSNTSKNTSTINTINAIITKNITKNIITKNQ